MENKIGLYKTVLKASGPILYKDRKSKFYAYTFPITEEKDVKPIIESLRKKHATANHVCYAWRIGVQKQTYRANDDGEPNNSAGIPIYGQIKSFELTNVLIAAVRYADISPPTPNLVPPKIRTTAIRTFVNSKDFI